MNNTYTLYILSDGDDVYLFTDRQRRDAQMAKCIGAKLGVDDIDVAAKNLPNMTDQSKSHLLAKLAGQGDIITHDFTMLGGQASGD